MTSAKKILVGLSGGVDSAVSAYLLREAGYDVACGFMINYLDESNPSACPTLADLEEAKKVSEFLGLPFFTFDYREEYESRIIDYIYREYAAGRTPNPDVFCNNLVKFDLFLEEALSLGYNAIATGHYARLSESGGVGSWELGVQSSQSRTLQLATHHSQLLKGIDPTKDQSYFLSRLSTFQLSKAIFPIGGMLKSEVRALAHKIGLPNASRKDSQGLCFIGKVPMKEFLERRLPKNPGPILDTSGNVIGAHEGAFSYTIGQRKGIKVGGGPALFVIAKDTITNTITVGTESELELFSRECTLTDWIGEMPLVGRKYSAKIRYRQEDQECSIIVNSKLGIVDDEKAPLLRGAFGERQGGLVSQNITIQFKNPQRAITSGQICVIYDGERVVGSGVIQ